MGKEVRADRTEHGRPPGRGGAARIALGATQVCFLLTLAACATCAPHQRISITSAPGNATVFVDGETAGHSPLKVDLRSDRDHSVFLKRNGYRPELVILRSQNAEEKPRLDPEDVNVRLVPIEHGRDLDVEVESPGQAPIDPNWRGNTDP